MRMRRPQPPSWTDDPVLDAARYDEYLRDLEEYEEELDENDFFFDADDDERGLDL